MPSSACDWSSDVCSSDRSEEHTSELQSRSDLVCRLLLEKKKKDNAHTDTQHDGTPDPNQVRHIQLRRQPDESKIHTRINLNSSVRVGYESIRSVLYRTSH